MGRGNQKSWRAVLAAVTPIVEAAGGTCTLQHLGGKHARLEIRLGDQVRHTPVSCSPRSLDIAVVYKINDVRRILKEMLA